MAEKSGAKVTLMHIIQAFYSEVKLPDPIATEVEVSMRRDGERKLADFFDLPNAYLPAGVEAVIRVGEPALEIAEYAGKNEVDLIMRPTHGYGIFRRLLIGSVAAKVLYDVACPVWTAAHTDDLSLSGHAKCENILCAVDLKPDDVPIMRRSFKLARLFNAKLRFVHAVPPADPQLESFGEGVRRAMLDSARQELSRMQLEAGTAAPTCVESGSVSSLVREAALQHDIDLVVIGRGKLHKNLGRLRTNAYGIIRESPCPVLSL